MLEVFAVAVGQSSADERASSQNVKTDRRFRKVGVLRPAFDQMRRNPINKAPERAGGHLVVRAQACAPRNSLPDRLKLVALINPRREVMRGSNNVLLGINPAVFMRVVKHAAAVVVDERLGQGALGDDHIVAVEFDVVVLDCLSPLGLDDADPIYEFLRLDQHTFPMHALEIHGVTRRNPKAWRGTFSLSAPALIQIGKMSLRPKIKRPS